MTERKAEKKKRSHRMKYFFSVILLVSSVALLIGCSYIGSYTSEQQQDTSPLTHKFCC